MIDLSLWRARIGHFVPKSSCPRRELLVRHVEKRSLNVDVLLNILLTLVISSVTSTPEMLTEDVDANADHQQKQSKYTQKNFF